MLRRNSGRQYRPLIENIAVRLENSDGDRGQGCGRRDRHRAQHAGRLMNGSVRSVLVANPAVDAAQACDERVCRHRGARYHVARNHAGKDQLERHRIGRNHGDPWPEVS